MLSRSFIYDNGASLKGKGYDFAVRRVTQFLAKHYRRHGREGYALVFDFSKYFDTAQHAPVFRAIESSGIDERLVSLSEYFIKCFGDEGLGLGSQVSQIAAIALPNRIDHYIKDTLGVEFYERYMDDGVIIHHSKEKLRECLAALRRLCAEHGIRLNEKKAQIVKLTRGFTFLKVRYRLGSTGAVIRRPSYKSAQLMKRKLKIFRRWVDSGRMPAEAVATSFVSWNGHMKRFRAYYIVRAVRQRYRELFEDLGGQSMEYVVHTRFKGKGIGGYFNLPYGTVCTEAGASSTPRTVAVYAPPRVKTAGSTSGRTQKKAAAGSLCLICFTITTPRTAIRPRAATPPRTLPRRSGRTPTICTGRTYCAPCRRIS
jgi:hypothetical protein